MKFIAAFEKTAAFPGWLHQMPKGQDLRKSVPSYSRKGVQAMWKRRAPK